MSFLFRHSRSIMLYCLLILMAVLVFVICCCFNAIDIRLTAIISTFVYFVFINLLLKKYSSRFSPTLILVSVLLGCSLIPIVLLPDMFLPIFLSQLFAIIMGYFFYKSNKILKIIIVFLFLLYIFWFISSGLSMHIHKRNYNNYTGKVEDVEFFDFEVLTNTGDIIRLSNLQGRYLLLDCWYTYCGICYEKMPEVQKLFEQYKNDKNNIGIYSLHCSLITKEKISVPEMKF